MAVGSCEFESHLLHLKLKLMRNFRCQRVGKFIFTQRVQQKISSLRSKRGNSSVGRAQPCPKEKRFPTLAREYKTSVT